MVLLNDLYDPSKSETCVVCKMPRKQPEVYFLFDPAKCKGAQFNEYGFDHDKELQVICKECIRNA
mgnify:CR=1 FL=1